VTSVDEKSVDVVVIVDRL